MAKVHENKQAFAAIIIALILLIGAIFVFSKSQKNSDSMMDSQKQSTESKSKDLKSILTSGKNLQCNFEYFKNEDEQTAGVVYVSGDNVRFDASSYYGLEDSDIFMIRKGNTNYIWGSQLPKDTGLKMEATIDELFANPQAKSILDPEKYEYGCQDWKVDPTAFDLPEKVIFTDLIGLMRLMITPAK